MPLPEGVAEELRPDDTVLVSFPRSGSTWLRMLVTDVFLQQRGYATRDLNLKPIVLGTADEVGSRLLTAGGVVPGLYRLGVFRDVQQALETPAFFKAHSLASLDACRVVYLFRQPADALVSYYHFAVATGHFRTEDLDLPTFCRGNVTHWINDLLQALERAGREPERICFVCYEDLLNDPAPPLRRVLDFLSAPYTADQIYAAIRHRTFDRLQRLEQATNSSSFFFRKGRAGTAREELDASVVRTIYTQTRAVYRRARRLARAGT